MRLNFLKVGVGEAKNEMVYTTLTQLSCHPGEIEQIQKKTD